MRHKTSENEKRKLQKWTLGRKRLSRVNGRFTTKQMVAALGHGILDIDTEKLINISSGEFVTTNILKNEKRRKKSGRIREHQKNKKKQKEK